MTGLDRCQVCGRPATVWWPAVDGQWCDRHEPDDDPELPDDDD